MLITWEKSGARRAARRLARSGAGNQESWGLTAQGFFSSSRCQDYPGLPRFPSTTQHYPGLPRTTQDYPGLPRTTQELVRPVVLSITDSCAKHYSSKWWFGPVMISILPRDYPGTTQASQTSCAKHSRAVMLIITGPNHNFEL